MDALGKRYLQSVLKDSSEFLKAVQVPRVAAALVIGALLTLLFVDELRLLSESLEAPAWTPVAVGLLVFTGVGVLVVRLVTLSSDAVLPMLGSLRRERARTAAAARTSRDIAEKAAASLENRIRDLTAHERDFLDLFAPESRTAMSMEKELLSRDVYGAVHSLISAGIIERIMRRDDPKYTERYRIARAAVGLVQTHVLNQPLGREEVTLDLSRVQGTGASGGGARGWHS